MKKKINNKLKFMRASIRKTMTKILSLLVKSKIINKKHKNNNNGKNGLVLFCLTRIEYQEISLKYHKVLNLKNKK